MNSYRVTLIVIFVLTQILPNTISAQKIKTSSEILSKEQVAGILKKSVRDQFNISFSILRIYKYVDKSGLYYCILTEKIDSIDENDGEKPDTVFSAIRTINLKEDSGKFTKVWEINDHVIRDPKVEGKDESIWFWTRYVEFTDCDGDGFIDPIIVYGTYTDSDMVPGRIKFIIHYKGKKVAIRHTDSDLDEGRITEVDKDYYTLPQALKQKVKSKMDAMNKAQQAIFDNTSF